MYRRLLTYLQTQRARRREPEVREAAFWRQHLGRLLAWPVGALFLLGLGWLILFQQLEAKRRQLETRRARLGKAKAKKGAVTAGAESESK